MIAPRHVTHIVLNQVVGRVVEELAHVVAQPCAPVAAAQAHGPLCWSWIKLEEPCSGVIALAQPLAQAKALARRLSMGTAPTDQDLLEAQCKLTRVIAGRTMKQLAGVTRTRLGECRFGPIGPDVQAGEWLRQTFALESSWMTLFIQADELVTELPEDAVAEPAPRRASTSNPLPIATDVTLAPDAKSSASARRLAVRTIQGLVPSEEAQAAADEHPSHESPKTSGRKRRSITPPADV